MKVLSNCKFFSSNFSDKIQHQIAYLLYEKIFIPDEGILKENYLKESEHEMRVYEDK
jgi:hypothetical protein